MSWTAGIITAAWAVMSAATFALYGADKSRARKGAWRISEKTLLLCALCLGAFGAAAGMGIFRHKTRHLKFRILVPFFCALNALVLLAAWGVL